MYIYVLFISIYEYVEQYLQLIRRREKENIKCLRNSIMNTRDLNIRIWTSLYAYFEITLEKEKHR